MRRQMLGKSMLEVPVVAAGCMRIQGMDETEVDEYCLLYTSDAADEL